MPLTHETPAQKKRIFAVAAISMLALALFACPAVAEEEQAPIGDEVAPLAVETGPEETATPAPSDEVTSDDTELADIDVTDEGQEALVPQDPFSAEEGSKDEGAIDDGDGTSGVPSDTDEAADEASGQEQVDSTASGSEEGASEESSTTDAKEPTPEAPASADARTNAAVLHAETSARPAVSDLVKQGTAYSITAQKGSQLNVTNASKAAKLQKSGDTLAGYWQLKAISGGLYQLINLADGSKLSYDAVVSAGSKATLTGAQSSWRIIAQADGGLSLGAVTASDLFLSVLGGAIDQGALLGFVSAKQDEAPTFFFVLSHALTEALQQGKALGNGAYAIASGLGGSQTLDVQYGSKASGAQVITYQGKGGLAFNQRYLLENVGNHLFTIKAMHSGKRLGVKGGSTSAGAAVVQQDATSSLSQLWYVVANGNGYSIRNAKTGYSIEVRGGKAKNVSAIQVGASKSATAQRFLLRRDVALSESERVGKTVTPGFYLLRSVLNANLVADIRYASMSNGAEVIVYKARSAQNQKLYLAYVGHGFYTLRVAHSGKYLGSTGNKAGAAVHQTYAHNGRSQMWYFVKSGAGYALRSAASGLSLALKGANDMTVRLNASKTTAAQQFKLSATQLVANGSYAFGTQQVYGGWLVFETYGRSKAHGANVSMWRTNGGSNQRWKVTHLGGGVYRITNAYSGLVLGVAGASTAHGANVRQQTLHNGTSQQWILEIAAGGGVAFKNRKSGKYLELAGGARGGANVRQANATGGKAQGWIVRTGKGNVKLFAERMYYYCEKANLGYDQSNRWDIRNGGECDCSSLVVHCLQESGFDTGQATLTFNYREELCPRGWKVLPANLSTARVGDILLNDDWHTAAVVRGSGWNALVAQASIDENGWIEGGRGGDQTGRETWTRAMFDYRYGWYCILRYVG